MDAISNALKVELYKERMAPVKQYLGGCKGIRYFFVSGFQQMSPGGTFELESRGLESVWARQIFRYAYLTKTRAEP